LSRAVAVLAVAAVCVTLGAASPAAAAAPANDARTSPQALGALPVSVQATTAESTVEPDEPGGCSALKGSVWYSFTPSVSRAVVLALVANGDLDATVDIFARSRSQLSGLGCSATDKRGEAVVDVDVEAGTEYLIRVGQLFNSVAGTFTLRVVAPDEPATAPGDPLPAKGVAGKVDRFANADDAWAMQLTRGTTYRVNFVTKGDGCATAEVYPPGSGKRFSGSSIRRLRCDAHSVFTADRSGTFSVLVTAPRASRAALPYRLRAGVARPDDSAPGIALAADVDRRGSLHGSELDALDLYRFGVAHRSDMRIKLDTKAAFEIRLMKPGGRLLGAGSSRIDARLPRGRYYIAVRSLDGADGAYVLRRHARTITQASILVNGRRSTAVSSGRSVSLTLTVRPGVNGPGTMLVERLDPIDGWLFVQRLHPSVTAGRATVAFVPPRLGRYRVTASFDGTFTASPSFGGSAVFSVVEPLTLSAL
jgi:hypothetical protein